MYCPECGIEINGEYKFCPKCGFNLEKILLLLDSSRPKTTKAYNVKAIRQTYSMAYEKWTKDEEAELTSAFRQGLTIAQLAEKHRRKIGAIRSRLIKLGLIK